jgi:hypothetical protein
MMSSYLIINLYDTFSTNSTENLSLGTSWFVNIVKYFSDDKSIGMSGPEPGARVGEGGGTCWVPVSNLNVRDQWKVSAEMAG